MFFHSSRSGRCRRVEALLAQTLQRGGNHHTFLLYRVDVEEKPELASRFGIDAVPTLLVVEGRTARARLELTKGSVRDIQQFLSPWLRRA